MQKRMMVLVGVIAVLAMLVSACAAPAPTAPTAAPVATQAPAAAAPTAAPAAPAAGKQFAGVQLTLLMHPTLYGTTGGDDGLVQEFERETGATVTVVKADIQPGLEKLNAEFLAKTGTYDVFNVEHSWLSDEFKANLEPLNDRLAALPASYDVGDLIPSLVNIGKKGDSILGIPYRIGTTMLYFRKDLLEAAGLKPPANYEEMLAASKALTKDTDGDGKIDMYGFAMRGKDLEVQHDYLQVLYAMGGSVLSPDNSACTAADAAGVATLQFFADVYQAGATPPDVLAWGRDDMIAAMQQGKAAMGIMYSPYWGRLVDPAQSKFPDKMGWAFVPTAPGVTPGRTRIGGWHLAMDKNGKNKDAAFALMVKLTTKEAQLMEALKFANGPIRTSVYVSPEYMKGFPLAGDWEKSTAAGVGDSNHPRFAEMRDVMSALVPQVMQGTLTAQAAADEYCKQVDGILKR